MTFVSLPIRTQIIHLCTGIDKRLARAVKIPPGRMFSRKTILASDLRNDYTSSCRVTGIVEPYHNKMLFRLLKNKYIDFALTAIFLILIIGGIVLAVLNNQHALSGSTFEVGRRYLESQASRDVNEIDRDIFNSRREKVLQEVAVRMEEDPDYVWQALADIGTVMTGDSRVGVFESAGFMDASHVVWAPATAMEEVVDYDRIVAAAPHIVVIAFGLNDIGLLHMTPEDFAAAACGIVDDLQAMLPDAYIYVQSTLPPSPEGSDTVFTYDWVTEWSDREIAYYKEHGYRYLDINFLIWDHMDLYADDGFHFQPDFYPYWAAEILKQYLYDVMEQSGDTEDVMEDANGAEAAMNDAGNTEDTADDIGAADDMTVNAGNTEDAADLLRTLQRKTVTLTKA